MTEQDSEWDSEWGDIGEDELSWGEREGEA